MAFEQVNQQGGARRTSSLAALRALMGLRGRLSQVLAWKGWTRTGVIFAAGASMAVLLYLGRNSTFFGDEWTFIDTRWPLTVDGLMRPHNEHWSLLLVLVYSAVFSVVGMHSYLPYLAVLLLLHLTVAAALFRLVRGAAGLPLAACCTSVFVFFGSGYENLFWAFQIGFVGSTAAGTWALVVAMKRGVSPSRWLLVALLLTAAVATQGVGLFFVASVLVYLVADSRPRKEVTVSIGPPIVIYAVWFLAYGTSAVGVHRDPFTLDAVRGIPEFIVTGGTATVAAVTGLGPGPGLVGFVVLVGAAVLSLYHRRHDPLAIACVAGLAAQFVLIGLVRGQLGLELATSSRYLYVSSVFILVAAGSLIARPAQWHRFMPIAIAPILATAFAWNIPLMLEGRTHFADRGSETRAVVDLMARGVYPSITQPSRPVFPLPGPARLRELIESHGSPAEDVLMPGRSPSPADALDRAVFRLAIDDIVMDQVTALPPELTAVNVGHTNDFRLERTSDCAELKVVGADPWVQLTVPGSSRLFVSTDYNGELKVFLGLYALPQEAASTTFEIHANGAYRISLPDLGNVDWRVRLDPPAQSTTLRVCAAD